MRMNGCRRHLTHADAAHADPANPDANVAALWERQEEVIIGLLALYTTSEVYCHDPSHGGFYMVEGALYIRIGLPPRVVSGDCLVSSRYGLTARSLHCRHTYPMSRDWGCTSTCYQSFYVPISSMRP